jgi:predicted RNase H-like HicB family nuclease
LFALSSFPPFVGRSRRGLHQDQCGFRLRALRALRSTRRPAELPSPLYAARLVALRVTDGAAPETSERYRTCRGGGVLDKWAEQDVAMRYRVLIEQDEDGVFVAEVPSLPGCISQGGTRDEALSNVREAIALYLESLEAHSDPVPPPITEEIIEV